MYIVSARKYRPSTFASVVGQRALTSTLKNAIATGRLAHSYLFCGSRGVPELPGFFGTMKLSDCLTSVWHPPFQRCPPYLKTRDIRLSPVDWIVAM